MRRHRARRAPAGWRRSGTRAGTIQRGVDFVVSGGHGGADRPVRADLPADERAALRWRTTRPTPTGPFDARANGYVPGEGGAILIVEEAGHAKNREAPQVYGEIAGYGATNDAFHAKQASGDGSQLARAMRMALERAGVGPDDVDVVFADAAGVPEADRAEA